MGLLCFYGALKVSLPIDAAASAPGPPIQGNGESRVIHFDATLRRKEKMRQKATGGTGNTGSNEESPGRIGATEVAPSHPDEPAAMMPAEAAFQPPQIAPRTPSATASVAESSTGASAADENVLSSKPASQPVLRGKALESFLVEFVVEQTGYPSEMVELDADLEADLGIDSIKKAQLFGELAEHFDVTANVEELSLDDFPTLRHVMDFLSRQAEADPADNGADNGKVSPPPMAAIPAAVPTAPVAVDPPPSAETTAAPLAAVAEMPQTLAQVESPTKSAANTGLTGQELEQFLVNFVVEQTGYPSEMVELDADLEADLGIDSIKKAQLFGELAEHFEVTANVEELSLDDFPTLRHVMNFLEGMPQTSGSAGEPPQQLAAPLVEQATPHVAQPERTAAAPAEVTPNDTDGDDLAEFLVNFVVEQTGYPPEMVELDADLEADLGIDSIKKAQLFGELAEYFEVQVTTEELSLDDFPTLRHVMTFLQGVPRRVTAQ